ncbi:MAG TPA: single-stranded DNA-binding protein [Bacteroidales bacterium]|jgi:single-strand DNA-binding protein|nr:single-stranded DNA-binding protein [Bacteroidales bacterium]MBP9000060.1 single-stranded DNA-binding protein [Bacteroidales bacterium]MCZ2316997.1 single-stranded DNA-binding protein [Bacteroidales bacterium]NLZ08257.1 single-stranded DNA-binding protein [Bacteroidales bacterium]HNR27018.1 single-stranded DNA-binding protein [Bacteroidales bacterium]
MLNKVMLIGNVGKDPEVRHLESGVSVTTLTLATTERFKDRNGEMKEQTEWHNVVLWRNLADIAERFVRKGSQIYIEGKIRSRSWEDQSGQKKYTTEIVADSMQLLGKRSEATTASPSQPSPVKNVGQSPWQNQEPVNDAVSDFDQPDVDDLPF